jgi:hypothetical protein
MHPFFPSSLGVAISLINHEGDEGHEGTQELQVGFPLVILRDLRLLRG